MIIDLLKHYKALTTNEEFMEYQDFLNNLENKNIFVGYMPTHYFDLKAIDQLNNKTKENKILDNYQEQIYFLPSNRHGYQYFSTFLRDYYIENKSIKNSSYIWLRDWVLERILLLRTTIDLTSFHILDINNNNNIYNNNNNINNINFNNINAALLTFTKLINNIPTTMYLFIIPHLAEDYIKYFEKYDVNINILIHTNRGLGDYLYRTELYNKLITTPNRTILPKYYFRSFDVFNEDYQSKLSQYVEKRYIENTKFSIIEFNWQLIDKNDNLDITTCESILFKIKKSFGKKYKYNDDLYLLICTKINDKMIPIIHGARKKIHLQGHCFMENKIVKSDFESFEKFCLNMPYFDLTFIDNLEVLKNVQSKCMGANLSPKELLREMNLTDEMILFYYSVTNFLLIA